MRGRISLKDFIHRTKQELDDARRGVADPLFELAQVELEVSFGVNVTGGASADLFVVDLDGEAKAEQLHKVRLTLLPLGRVVDEQERASPGKERTAGGGSSRALKERIVYAPVKRRDDV